MTETLHLAVDGQGVGIEELARPSAGGSPGPERLAGQVELLHSVIAVFADVEAMVRADRQIVRITHLTRCVAARAPRIEEFPLGVENLDAVVAAIGDEEPVFFVDRQRPGLQEFARLIAVAAPLAEPFPFGREDLNAIVLAVLGDVEIAGLVDDDVGRIAESPGRRALHAVADLEEDLAVGRVDEHAIEVGIGDQQPAQPVDRQSARAVDVEHRACSSRERYLPSRSKTWIRSVRSAR